MSTTTQHDRLTASPNGVAHTAIRTAVATGIAVASNTLVWAFGRIGEPIRVIIGSDSEPAALTWWSVALTTIVATVLGGVALAVTRRLGRSERVWQFAVMVLAVVSAVPLWWLDIDVASKSLLTVMHLLTGACSLVAHQRRPAIATP
jgi:hypothetical protein